MFLHVLNGTEQQAFAVAAVTLVHTDGVVDDREQVLLQAVATELGLAQLPQPTTWEAVLEGLAAVYDPGAQRVIMLELAGVSTSDDEVHSEEMRALRQVADLWKTDEAFIDRCLAFAQKAHSVWREGYAIVNANRMSA